MKKRVLLAGLSHETHTFIPKLTRLQDFHILEDAGIRAAQGDVSGLAGVWEVAEASGWEVVPVVHMSALPGPLVADEVVETFWERFAGAVKKETKVGLDGVMLMLHGAMVSESYTDVEGELLQRIHERPELTNVPVCGSLDLHCNFTANMATYSSALFSYRENPHTDIKQTAVCAARALERLMDTGEKPVTIYAHPSLIWTPSGNSTREMPMRALEQRAREIEAAHPEMLVVNVFGGYAFADIPEVGVSFSAVTVGDPESARQAVDELSAMALDMRELGNVSGIDLETVLDSLPEHPQGPVLLVESADNIGGGTPGDITFILRKLVERDIHNAGVIINDAQTVQGLQSCEIGARVHVDIGGKSGVVGAEPLTLEVELQSLSDGTYNLEDPHSHLAGSGQRIHMGPCAVVRHRGIIILLTSHPSPPFDLGQWRSQGVNPEELDVIVVKAAAAHRQAYDPIAAASYTVDTPGPCTENL
ncbi:MAG: M81 family metallopeptidase, partial [Anaerolineae bacterium]|nr:M81 family metallopeptidase [Anaerolineae bacterium]